MNGLALSIAVLLLSGCAGLTVSDYRPPAVDRPAGWRTPTATGDAAPFRWRDFGDPALERWLAEVSARNSDLALAVQRLERARLAVRGAQLDAEPKLSAGLDASGRRALDSGERWRQSSSSQLRIGYEADPWGQFTARQAAAKWSADATAEDLAAARLTLLAEASNSYWQLGFLNQQIASSAQSVEYALRTLQLANVRYRAGQVPALDRLEAEQNVIARQNSYRALLQQRDTARNVQAVLLGAPPGVTPAEPRRLPTGTLPTVRAAIPATALARRPDLRARELRLREALAETDARRARFYPTFNLTGSLGGSSQQLLDFISNPVATLGASIAFPFLQWRQRDLEIRIARNDYRQRAIAFRQALYQAMADIENALAERARLQEQETRLRRALALAGDTERRHEVRYREGATAINFWLEAQESRRRAQLELDSNRYDQLRNLSRIFVAFGGN